MKINKNLKYWFSKHYKNFTQNYEKNPAHIDNWEFDWVFVLQREANEK